MLALYTMIVDRLDYTIATIRTLEDDNDIEFVHFILSQGSESKTDDWLRAYKFKNDTHLYFWDENRGISKGSNFLIDRVTDWAYVNQKEIRVIAKVDNDIETVTPDWLGRCYDVANNYMILCSPLILGLKIFPDGVPGYANQIMGGERIRLTHHIGGIVHMAKTGLHTAHTYPEDMTYALDQDITLSRFAKKNFYLVGYLEDVKVRHRDTTDGQKRKYPEYFHIKETVWEKETPNG